MATEQTRLIRMTTERRGGLGEGRYRTFTEGEIYVVDAPGANGVPAFLADQFVQAGEAEAISLQSFKAGEVRVKDLAADGEPDARTLKEHTVAELREIAKGLGLTGYSRKREDELIAMIEEAREAQADEGDDSGDPE